MQLLPYDAIESVIVSDDFIQDCGTLKACVEDTIEDSGPIPLPIISKDVMNSIYRMWQDLKTDKWNDRCFNDEIKHAIEYLDAEHIFYPLISLKKYISDHGLSDNQDYLKLGLDTHLMDEYTETLFVDRPIIKYIHHVPYPYYTENRRSYNKISMYETDIGLINKVTLECSDLTYIRLVWVEIGCVEIDRTPGILLGPGTSITLFPSLFNGLIFNAFQYHDINIVIETADKPQQNMSICVEGKQAIVWPYCHKRLFHPYMCSSYDLSSKCSRHIQNIHEITIWNNKWCGCLFWIFQCCAGEIDTGVGIKNVIIDDVLNKIVIERDRNTFTFHAKYLASNAQKAGYSKGFYLLTLNDCILDTPNSQLSLLTNLSIKQYHDTHIRFHFNSSNPDLQCMIQHYYLHTLLATSGVCMQVRHSIFD